MNDYENAPTFSVSAFDVDGMLAGLAKWLRILGFDAAHPCSMPSEGRVFVTRKTSINHPDAIIITEDRPLEQLIQVLEQTRIVPDPELLMSRCLVCNHPVEEISRDKVEGRVPHRVFETKQAFHHCVRCGRLYWDGGHVERIKQRLEKVYTIPDITGESP